jgi:hypothetical protein
MLRLEGITSKSGKCFTEPQSWNLTRASWRNALRMHMPLFWPESED